MSDSDCIHKTPQIGLWGSISADENAVKKPTKHLQEKVCLNLSDQPPSSVYFRLALEGEQDRLRKIFIGLR